MTAINMVFVITRLDPILVTVSLDMKEMEHGVKVQMLYFIILTKEISRFASVLSYTENLIFSYGFVVRFAYYVAPLYEL